LIERKIDEWVRVFEEGLNEGSCDPGRNSKLNIQFAEKLQYSNFKKIEAFLAKTQTKSFNENLTTAI
jgi:hypothetical protein